MRVILSRLRGLPVDRLSFSSPCGQRVEDRARANCEANGSWKAMVRRLARSAALLGASLLSLLALAQASRPVQEPAVSIDWQKTVLISKSTPTLQVVVNPMLREGAPIHDSSFAALRELGADYVRYVPWLPYPRLAVAELEPPSGNSTSWDFSLIDPITRDFMAATDGHPVVMNFSTIPAWLFKTPQPVTYPKDPDEVNWNYTQGTELVDPSCKQLADYYARLVSWYTRGGFTDENGKRHVSGYHYKFPVWEIFNEVDSEHDTSPEQYARRYDAVVNAIRAIDPDTKFMGLALDNPSFPINYVRWFKYFLDHAHHAPGIPLDFISYHFYAHGYSSPALEQGPDDWQHLFFDQADAFLDHVRAIEAIRKRLSPETRTDIDELGANLPKEVVSIPEAYWNASAAVYAYLFIGLSQQGIDIIGESQLVGYPTQVPGVTMIDWKNGKPNARYWALKLIKDNFHPGDRIVETRVDGADQVAGEAFVAGEQKKLLLVNKRNTAVKVSLPAGGRRTIQVVDGQTGENEPQSVELNSSTLELNPFAVAVIAWK